MVYGQEIKSQISGLCYFVSWKKHQKEESSKELTLGIIPLWKLINTFPKEHPEKLTVASLALDSALPMAGLTVAKKQPEQKCGRSSKKSTKEAKS